MNRGIVVAALTGSVLFGASFSPAPSLEQSLKNKSRQERVEMKSDAIVEKAQKGIVVFDDLAIEIVSVEKIEGGVQAFAKAWKSGEPIGFGEDGSVEIERFRIFNPPVLVDDPNGEIVREWTDELTGQHHERRLREDPSQALLESLVHTIRLVGKGGENIIPGKVGNTTSTFYPNANPESTSFDGATRRSGDLTLTDIVNGTAGTTDDSMTATPNLTRALALGTSGTSNQYAYADHSFFLFDTSALVGQAVSSATFSVVGNSTPNNGLPLNATDRLVTLVSSNPASNTGLAGADHGTIGSTSFGTFDPGAAFASWSTAGYNDITLNGSGISNISTTGVSKFGLAFAVNVNRLLTSTWSSGKDTYLDAIFADTSGTSSDPKLVVVHAAAATTNNPKIITID